MEQFIKNQLNKAKILNLLKWFLLVFFVIDLMWGTNGFSGRYIAMFLDNFSPFQNKDETRLASNLICSQYAVSKPYQLK